MKFNRNKVLPAAIALALSPSVFAQSQETELEPVVVTANRVARTADETLTSVTVITRKDVEQQQAQSVPDLLRGLPGVQFSNNGGPGKATSLFLRGTNDGHTLVLIDGVRVGSATLGGTSLQDLPVELIERIELVRGPRASLYGSEAIGGVIQIFTKKGPQPASLSLTGGTRHTFEGSAAGGFGSPDAWVNLATSAFTTSGINARNNYTEGDRDGYNRGSASVRGGGRIGEKLNFDLQALHTEGRNENDGTPNSSDVQQDVYSGNLGIILNDNYTSNVRLAQSLDASRNFTNEKFYSRFDTRRTQTAWQNDITLSKGHQIVAGLDFQYDEVLSSTSYGRDKRTNRAAFAQYLADLGAFDLQVAGRHDRNEQFGSHNTGSIAGGYTFSPALRLRASHGKAFKAPTFNDLYWPGSESPDLLPEKSRSSEIGASGKLRDFGWQISAFRTEIKNLIAWAPAPTPADPFRWAPSNVSRARIKGLELSARQSFGNTILGANATFLQPEDHGDYEGNLLIRRARQSARFDADHSFGAWSVGGSLNAVGKRYNDQANNDKLGGYVTVDLRAEYSFTPEWRGQVRVANLFDKRYESVLNYNQPGIGAYLTLRYQPK